MTPRTSTETETPATTLPTTFQPTKAITARYRPSLMHTGRVLHIGAGYSNSSWPSAFGAVPCLSHSAVISAAGMQTTSSATMSRLWRDRGRTESQAVHRSAGPMIDFVIKAPFEAEITEARGNCPPLV